MKATWDRLDIIERPDFCEACVAAPCECALVGVEPEPTPEPVVAPCHSCGKPAHEPRRIPGRNLSMRTVCAACYQELLDSFPPLPRRLQ